MKGEFSGFEFRISGFGPNRTRNPNPENLSYLERSAEKSLPGVRVSTQADQFRLGT
jgi:hypothetical protein